MGKHVVHDCPFLYKTVGGVNHGEYKTTTKGTTIGFIYGKAIFHL